MISSFYNRKTAKLKFFALYAFSVLLVVVLFLSLFGATIPEVRKSSLPVTVTGGANIMQLYLSKMGTSFANAVAAAGNQTKFRQQDSALKQQLDSARQMAATILNSEQRQAVEATIQAYENGIQRFRAVLQSSSAQRDTVYVNAGAANAALLELQKQMAQKVAQLNALEQQKQMVILDRDKTIAQLRNQLAASLNSPRLDQASNQSAGAAAELRKKAENLKAQNEKYLSQINTLRESYKQVVEDNRRLLSKLQEMRSGRNGQR